MGQTIRQRILVTFTAITLIGGLFLFLVAGSQLEAATLDFYQQDLTTRALTAASSLTVWMETLLEGEGGVSSRPFDLGSRQNIGLQYTIMDGDHRLLSDSRDAGYNRLEVLPETSELRDAQTNGVGFDIRMDETGQQRAYVAAPIRGDEEHLFGYLRVSALMEPAYAEARQRRLELAGVTLPVLMLVVIASLWIGRTITRPIQQVRTAALRMADGELDSRIPIQSKDEIGELAGAFNFMAERLQELIHAQRNFVSNAAHELRAPIMSARLRIEALQQGTLDAQQQATYMRELSQDVDHMAGLVTSLLVLARLDEGHHPGKNEPYDAVALLQDISRHWRIQAQKRGLTMSAELPTDLPAISVSSSDLRIVLDNLLSNAVKYTCQGKITIQAQQKDGKIYISVTDTGEGFQPGDAERLFERFYRSGLSRNQQVAGTGLGLSIVQSMLAYYGGKITARSPGIGQGATFEVEIPL